MTQPETPTALPDDAEIFVHVKDLRDLFDMICCSMDFGSGFFDTEQVNLIRRIAVILAVDPMEATPSSQAKEYPHRFKAAAAISELRRGNPWCKYCYGTEDQSWHSAAEPVNADA
jgi:hypothetical protein